MNIREIVAPLGLLLFLTACSSTDTPFNDATPKEAYVRSWLLDLGAELDGEFRLFDENLFIKIHEDLLLLVCSKNGSPNRYIIELNSTGEYVHHLTTSLNVRHIRKTAGGEILIGLQDLSTGDYTVAEYDNGSLAPIHTFIGSEFYEMYESFDVALGDDGIYLWEADNFADTFADAYLTKYDFTGDQEWELKIYSNSVGRIGEIPQVYADYIYLFGVVAGDNFELLKINVSTGALAWRKQESEHYSYVTENQFGEYFVIQGQLNDQRDLRHSIIKFNNTGMSATPLWTCELSKMSSEIGKDFFEPPASTPDGGFLYTAFKYVNIDPEDDQKLASMVKLNSDGEVTWSGILEEDSDNRLSYVTLLNGDFVVVSRHGYVARYNKISE
jgi:PQQ-like domain